jgi:hypothetical protein
MRKEIGATRDEVLWEMPLPELNQMLHAYYHMEGRDTRKPQKRSALQEKLARLTSLFKR